MSVHEITLGEAARKDRMLHEYVPRHLYEDVASETPEQRDRRLSHASEFAWRNDPKMPDDPIFGEKKKFLG